MAYAGYLMGDELDSDTKEKLKSVVAAEADYNTNRTIPTQVKSDTKAEENGTITAISQGTANIWVFVNVEDYWVKSSVEVTVTASE